MLITRMSQILISTSR